MGKTSNVPTDSLHSSALLSVFMLSAIMHTSLTSSTVSSIMSGYRSIAIFINLGNSWPESSGARACYCRPHPITNPSGFFFPFFFLLFHKGSSSRFVNGKDVLLVLLLLLLF